MNTARLTAKLAIAGLPEEEIETLSREQLLDKWAEILLAGKTVPTESKSNFNIEFERERLQFEKEKFAAKTAEAEERRLAREAELKMREMEAEERRMAREEAKLAAAWERTRLDEEKVERRKANEAEAERAKQQLIQLQLANRLQQEAMEKEKWKNDSVIAVLKQYGEAIRHSITKMADSPTEIIVFFDSVERLFSDLEVPEKYKVLLIKLYLNERAALLVNRLTGSEASDFEFVKKYLLDQFRLCPQFFWSHLIVYNELQMKRTNLL
jgi:hypothetical protein